MSCTIIHALFSGIREMMHDLETEFGITELFIEVKQGGLVVHHLGSDFFKFPNQLVEKPGFRVYATRR